jgi:hypothetical protein
MKKHILKVNLFDLFSSKKKAIFNLKISAEIKLLKLEEALKGIKKNDLSGIVELFQAISVFYDDNGFQEDIFALKKHNKDGSLDKQINALEIIQKHIKNAGRDPYGINRTVKGQDVSAANVFIGNVCGLFTQPVDHWLSHKAELKKAFRPDVSRDPENIISNWDIIEDQCKKFVDSHINGIIQQSKIFRNSWN